MLAQLRHPNVVANYGFVRQPPMLIMEIASAGSLAGLLERSTLTSLPWSRRHRILHGVACGVEYLHKQTPPIIHLDLKCANVLLGEGLVPRVSDFGLSIFPSVASRPLQVGTPIYMAPEMASGEPISDWKAVDSYGFGNIALDCAQSVTRQSAAAGQSAVTVTDMTMRISALLRGDSAELDGRAKEQYQVHVGEEVPPRLARLILACLELRPEARPSLAGVRLEMEGIILEVESETIAITGLPLDGT
jgi:serine/threonine protein kinase